MKRYSSSQDFMDEFVAKTRERFDAMEYYRKAEGMPEVPIENLAKKDETKSFEASLLAQLKRNRNNGKI